MFQSISRFFRRLWQWFFGKKDPAPQVSQDETHNSESTMSHVTYKIYPSIGVMRVGNSEEFYLAPESPGGLPINYPETGRPFTKDDFRDSQKRMKRQAAQFRIFKCEEGKDPVEVKMGQEGLAQIEWSCHLANKKSSWYRFMTLNGENGYSSGHPLRNPDVKGDDRFKLIIDAGPRTLKGPNQSADFSAKDNPDNYPVNFPPDNLKPHKITTLGQMHTQADGRLVIVGGYGNSGSKYEPVITEYANNDGWWDDTSDGPVTANLVFEDGEKVAVAPAWVLCGPPAYAPELINLVTLYDTIFDTAVRNMGYRKDIFDNELWNKTYKPNWQRDLLPMFQRIDHYQWVAAIPPKPHSFDWEILANPDAKYNAIRGYYMAKFRPPELRNQLKSKTDGYTLMPYLAGDDATGSSQKSAKFLTVTRTQYFYLQQWASGKFTNEEPAPMNAAESLTVASLDNCVGGAFSPGIEMTWISRNPKIYQEAFRIKVRQNLSTPLTLGTNFEQGQEPGDVSKYMACPWQADFNECSSQPVDDRFVWWWPAQRPEFVYVHDETEADGRREVPWIGIGYDQQAANFICFPNDLEMVEKWQDLGFVFNEGTADEPAFFEVDRILPPQIQSPVGD